MPDRAMFHQKALYSFSLMFLLGFTAPALGQAPAAQQAHCNNFPKRSPMTKKPSQFGKNSAIGKPLHHCG
jgi:hypothetical protein